MRHTPLLDCSYSTRYSLILMLQLWSAVLQRLECFTLLFEREALKFCNCESVAQPDPKLCIANFVIKRAAVACDTTSRST